jgi:serine protease Do
MRTTIAAVVLLAFLMGFTSSAAFAVEKNPKPGEGQKGGWLGVSIQDISPKIAKKKDLKSDEGAYVNDVVEKSPADSAGVKEGDVIVEFNGRKIDDADDLLRAVQKANAGSRTTIVVLRNNEKKSLAIAVGKPRRRNFNEGFAATAPRAPHMAIFGKSGMWGLRLSELNEQLGEYFGAPNGKGVLVEKVEKKSTGEKAGFRAGDVITKVNKSSVEDIRDLNEAAEDTDKGDKLEIEVLRKGANKILTVEIEEQDIEPSSFNFHFENLPDGEMMREFEMNAIPHGDFENLKMHLRRSLPDMRDLQLRIERIKNVARRITI